MADSKWPLDPPPDHMTNLGHMTGHVTLRGHYKVKPERHQMGETARNDLNPEIGYKSHGIDSKVTGRHSNRLHAPPHRLGSPRDNRIPKEHLCPNYYIHHNY
jgi:hypothetical protein